MDVADGGREGREGHGMEADESGVWVSPLRPGVAPATVARRDGRFWYRLAGSLTLLALAVTGILAWFHPTLPSLAQLIPAGPKPPADPLALRPASLRCVSDGAWSPDGTQIALLGNVACRNGRSDVVPTIAILDAKTGKQTMVVEVGDEFIEKESGRLRHTTGGHVAVFYYALRWSPDGRMLIAGYDATPPGGNAEARQYLRGLVRYNVASRELRATGGYTLDMLEGLTLAPSEWLVTVWDVGNGTATVSSVPMALRYRWGAGGRLQPDGLTGSTPEASPPAIGTNPTRTVPASEVVSVWQAASVYYVAATDCSTGPGGEPTPPSYSPDDYYTIATSGAAWSPDERYYAMVVVLGRLDERPAPPSATNVAGESQYSCDGTGDLGPATQLTVHTPDACLRAALSQLAINTQPSIQVAWSASGTRLAVQTERRGPGSGYITIYDCAGGRVTSRVSPGNRETLGLGTIDVNSGSLFATMAWSPDGARLLLVPARSETSLPSNPVVLGAKALRGER